MARQHRFSRGRTQFLQSRRQPIRAILGRPGGIQRLRAEGIAGQRLDAADLRQILIGQDRLRHFQPVMMAGLAPQQIRSRPDHGHQRHHQFLTDRVNRRISDLREILLEVMEQQIRFIGQHRKRRIGPHGTDRVIPITPHGLQEEIEVFLRIAESLLIAQQALGVLRALHRHFRRQAGQFLQLELGVLQPFSIGVFAGQLLLDFGIINDAPGIQINQQHAAWLQAPFVANAFLGDWQHAHFRCQHNLIIIGDDVARGAQPVAIQRRANLAAIGEGNGGRPIPGFHQRGMVFIESATFRVHQRITRPGFRD